MANNTRILGLQEQTTLSAGDYSVVDSVAGGTKRFDLGTLMDQVIADVPESVAEWLDQHPEATTTVQDGSITYAKLHSSTKQRLNNKLYRLVTAPVVTASDAYAAPPVALVVDGKSVQDGTPAPDAPVAIQSVESVGLAVSGKNLVTLANGVIRDDAGITWTANADGTLNANGSTDTTASWPYSNNGAPSATLPAGTYTVSVPSPFTPRVLNSSNNIIVYPETGNTATFTLDDTDTIKYFPTLRKNNSVSNATVWLQIEAGTTATPYQPYVGSTTAIPLQGHALRSLPDGTHDELSVDADGNVTLVQRVWAETFDGSSDESWQLSGQGIATTKYNGVLLHAASNNVAVSMLSSHFTARTSNEIYGGSNSVGVAIGASGVLRVGVFGESTTLANTVAWLAENPLTILAPLATPVEIPLGTVSLPSMPAPDLTAWASCTPATDIELDYERDVTIAVERLEAAIAELATN